ncbi:MAG: hypothetical protein GY942_05465 [Aestuariibacter sp.]|nr:hypothetical protein [Aestuariibacter sp.]
MSTTEEKQARIDEINIMLAGGVTSASTLNRSASYDLDALRNERAELRGSISGNPGGFRRVVFTSRG